MLRQPVRRMMLSLMAIFLAAACLSLPGCGDSAEVTPATLTLAGEQIRAGLLMKPLASELRFTVSGSDPAEPDTLLPAARARVRFTVVDQPEGAAGAGFPEAEQFSNAAGLVRTHFTVGNKSGIYRIEASLPDFPDIPSVSVTIVGGMLISGAGQDGRIDAVLDKPLSVTLESAPGLSTMEGVGSVRFTLMGAPAGTELSTSVGRTDSAGVAAADIRLGSTQGSVEVGITVLEGIPGDTAQLAPILVRFFAIDVWMVSITILGGLALFLFGMRMMSESLQFVAGEKLRDLLNLLTTNRFMAVGAGAMVTALIQSSSACTVMVVGFVNAGLMRLEQAIGVIMGANIGTTITAQIISLKLTLLALPAVFVGVVILFIAKRQSTKHWANLIIGFGILFLGMNVMSGQLGELRESASVISLFQGLDCSPGPNGYVPFLGFLKAVFCGLIVTLILQSSSATIGLLIAVASAGLLDPYASFGILLGDNIGTTITAVLASLGTGTTARRSAAFHVSFNVFGCALMLALNFINWPGQPGRPVFMELANQLTPGDVFRDGENLPRFIANAHTLFNVSCTALFISFIPQFARWCRWLVGERTSGTGRIVADRRRVLEPHLLSMPSLALQQVWTEVGVMLEKAREAQSEGYHALISDPALGDDWKPRARVARDLEKETDELKVAITKYMSGISLTTLNENQSEMFPHLVHAVNDAEKVADLGKQLSKLAKRVNKRSLTLTPEALEEINGMMAQVEELLQLAEKTVNMNADGIDRSGGGLVLRRKLREEGRRLGKAAKARASALRKNHEARHEQGRCDIKSGVVFLEVAASLGRSAGCAVNIVEAACHIPGEQEGKVSERL